MASKSKMASLSSQNVFNELSNILTGFIRELGTNIDLNRQDSIHRRLDQIARQFHRLPSLGSTLTDQVNTVLRLLDSLVEAHQNVGYSSYSYSSYRLQYSIFLNNSTQEKEEDLYFT